MTSRKRFGKHTIKAGVDYIYNPVSGGFFEFNSTLEADFLVNPSTILGDTIKYPQGFATPGLVGGMSFSNGDPYFLVPTKQLGFYGQDDWKVNNRLTLNLGLRWDRDFNWFGSSDIPQSRSYQSLLAIASVNPIAAYNTRHTAQDDTKDFSPRIGFAYDLTGAGRHVLRGGFGLYFGNTFQNVPLFMEQLANPTIFQTVLSLSAPTTRYLAAGHLGRSPTRKQTLRRRRRVCQVLHRLLRMEALAASWTRTSGTRYPRNSTSAIRGLLTTTRCSRPNTPTFSVCMRTKPSTSTRKS